MTNLSELREKTDAELVQLMKQLRGEALQCRMSQGTDEALKTHRLKACRRSIARLKTLLHERKRVQNVQ